MSSRLKDAIENLFDLNQPYFSAWVQIHKIDDSYPSYPFHNCTPLYCSALYGFYDLVLHLIAKRPEQVEHVIDHGGKLKYPIYPLLADPESTYELRSSWFSMALMLIFEVIPQFSEQSILRAIKRTMILLMLRHGADVNATEKYLWTPLHLAAELGYLVVAWVLLEHGAELNLRDNNGRTPLHLVSARYIRKREDKLKRSLLAQLLVEYGADVQARDNDNATPLHSASYHGRAEIAKLLLDHGAKAQVKDSKGRTPLHEVSPGIHRYMWYLV